MLFTEKDKAEIEASFKCMQTDLLKLGRKSIVTSNALLALVKVIGDDMDKFEARIALLEAKNSRKVVKKAKKNGTKSR